MITAVDPWDSALPGHRRFSSRDPVGQRLEFLEAL